MKGDKAPGPDGYNAVFHQRNWDIVGSDAVNAVQAFFSKGILMKEWNATVITLIPRTHCPSTIKDFEPISCFNVLYKCITKILPNRLQPVLLMAISQSQSAFIKGR